MDDIHAIAYERRWRELVEETATLCNGLTDDVRVTTCDLIGWAYRLAERGGVGPPSRSDVRGVVPDSSNSDHQLWGVVWARHRLTHGDADLLELEVSNRIVDLSYNSSDLIYDDPEVDYNARLVHGRTLRFARVAEEIPGDQRSDLQHFYNDCLAGCRVIVVAARLAAMGRGSHQNP